MAKVISNPSMTSGLKLGISAQNTSAVDYSVRSGLTLGQTPLPEGLKVESAPVHDALQKQEGGTHYKEMSIQPIEFITANNIPFMEGNCIKHLCRHRSKNKAEDIKKVIHYCELMLQLYYGEK